MEHSLGLTRTTHAAVQHRPLCGDCTAKQFISNRSQRTVVVGKGLSELAWMLGRTGTIMDAEEDKSRGHTNACFTLFERQERKR